MRNCFLRNLFCCVPLLLAGCSDVNEPTLPYPGIATTGITPTSVSLSWVKASDTISDPAALAYTVYLSGPNPAYQSFDTLAEVEAGTLVQTLTGADSITINSGITAGNAYYINIVVQDEEGNKALYDPLGEYFHAGLISYYPFNGNWNDATPTVNHLLIDPSLAITSSPTVILDRFAHVGSAYFFTPVFLPAIPQCLQSTLPVGISGSASRSVSFWVQSFNTPTTPTAGAAFAWGDSGTNGSIFGAFESGIGTDWMVWLGGTADVSTTTAATSNWEHWVIGYDGTSIYSYKNGALVPSAAAAVSTVDTLLYVGCGLNTGLISNPYTGNIDDVRVFNQLLSSAEVANLYTVTRP